jgi:hypothetical protein
VVTHKDESSLLSHNDRIYGDEIYGGSSSTVVSSPRVAGIISVAGVASCSLALLLSLSCRSDRWRMHGQGHDGKSGCPLPSFPDGRPYLGTVAVIICSFGARR